MTVVEVPSFTSPGRVVKDVLRDIIASSSSVSRFFAPPGAKGSTTVSDIEATSQDWLIAAASRLQKVAALPANWDNEGSPGTDQSLVACAESLLRRLQRTWEDYLPAPSVCPIAGGYFQFEWQVGGRYLEIQFTDPETLIFLTEEQTPQGPIMISGEYPASRLDQTRRLLLWLVGDD
jgi:hypothetical protein